MNKIVRGIGIAVAGIVVVGGGRAAYVASAASTKLTQDLSATPVANVPIPYPLDPAVVAALAPDPQDPGFLLHTAPDGQITRVPADLDAYAREQAQRRGKHLIETKLGCFECHGAEYAGKVVMDVPPVMGMIGPNITPGGVPKDYTDTDWVRILRHGIGKDGQPSLMPAEDYTMLSDQELGDVVTFLRSVAPSEQVMPPAYLGPVLKAQIVLGGLPLAHEKIDHTKPRPAVPPSAATASVELGDHLHHLCTGCHNARLSGGPIAGGDPSWPEASNLTPHTTGLAGYTFPEFKTLMATGVRKDGSKMREPMLNLAVNFYGKWSDAELESLYQYLQGLPAKGG